MNPSQTLQRPDLGIAFEEFSLEAQEAGFIALQVLRPFQTPRQAGNFSIVPLEEQLRDVDLSRSPGGAYTRDRAVFETINFSTVEYGTEEPVDDRERVLYAHYLNVDQVVARRNRMKVLRGLEKRAASLLFNTSNFANANVSTEWSTAASATPIADIRAKQETFRAAAGCYANALVISQKVFRNLRIVDEIQDLLKYNGMDDVKPDKVTARAIAACLEVDRLIVAGGENVKLTSAEGATPAISDIWDDEYALLCKVGLSDDLSEPCIGRIMHYSEDGSDLGVTMEMYRDETRRSDIVRSRMETDELLIHASFGYLLGNITA